MRGRGGLLRKLHRARRRNSVPVCALLAVALSAATASATGPQLKLAQVRTRGGAPLALKVVLSSDVPLGAYTLQVTFDSSRLELVAVDGGAGEFAAQPITNPEQFTSGVVRLSAFQPMRMDGPTGLCHVATLVFKRRTTRGSTRIEVEAITLGDTLGRKYGAAKVHRTVRLRGR